MGIKKIIILIGIAVITGSGCSAGLSPLSLDGGADSGGDGGGGGGGGGGTLTTALEGLDSCVAVAGDCVICGTAYAPDGRTPIVGAAVEQVVSPALSAPESDHERRSLTKLVADSTQCVTDNTGAFACGGIAVGSSVSVEIDGSGCAFTFDVPASCGTGGIFHVPAANTTATSGTCIGRKYAVVTGTYDSIESILARILSCGTVTEGELEEGTECAQIELIDAFGTNPNTALTRILGVPDGSYPSLKDLMENPRLTEALALFDGIFFNCGMDESYYDDPTVQAALRTYVENGGNLYLSDWAASYLERIWPSAIAFYGLAPHQDGNVNEMQPVTVADSELLGWLRSAGIIGPASADFNVNFDLPSWVVMTGVGVGTDAIITARNLPNGPFDIPILPATSIPITVDFASGSGCVFYTSYHNEPYEAVSPDAPQSRVLEYLVLNRFGSCN